MKILVVKRDKIGDLLLTTPMLEHLKARLPAAQLHLLANDYNAWVVAQNPSIDRLWVYRRVRHAGRLSLTAALAQIRLGFALRRERFDWAIVANGHESPRAIRRGLAAGAARVVAYCADGSRYPALTDPLAPPENLHECERLLGLLAPLGIEPPDLLAFPKYQLTDEQQAFARDWLAARGLAPGAYVVIGLGARRPKKQPAAAQILRWSNRLKADHGLNTVLIWTPGSSADRVYPGDDEVARPVLDAGVPHIYPFRGPILPAIALIWNARTTVIPDSGLMHFAAASPGGVLGLFAETGVSPHPAQWGPRGPRATYLDAPKSASELPDALVFEKLERLLDRRDRQPRNRRSTSAPSSGPERAR